MPSTFVLLLLLITTAIIFIPSTAFHSSPSPPPPPPQSRTLACKSTPYPKLCRSILSTIHSSPASDSYENYGKFSVKECKKQARRTSNLINQFLNSSKKKKRSYMSQAESRALNDCSQLSELSVDYLDTISNELSSAESPLSLALVDRVQSLLSAIITNQQTCLDGLKDSGSSIPSVLNVPFSNTTQLYSVSLGLVSHAMSLTRKRKRKPGKVPTADRFTTNGNDVDSGWRAGMFHSDSSEPKWVEKIKKRMRNGNRKLTEGGSEDTTVTVAKDGSGNFTTISDAISFAPNNTKNIVDGDGYFVVYITEGIYEDEYAVIPKYKKYIVLIGDGINKTVITGNRSVVDGWTTFSSATFAVSGEGFVAMDITFRNTAGPEKHQAVAVRSNADLSTFYRCSFEGYQDTLYIHSLRQFFRECDVYGTVDFIFGNSASVFQNCNLIARKPMPRQKNAITAQGRTDPNQNTGISIHNCTITASPELAADLNSTRTFLGRPWKEYSRTVFMQSYIDNVIDPVGWLEWNGTVGLSTLYYGEFDNHGEGANTSMRVQWPGYSLMSADQAVNFTVYNFTLGDTWIPSTNIPFSNGLL